jgi:hypothetical protein
MKHFADVTCSFFAAASPIDLFENFRNAGTGLFVEDGRGLCKIDPDQVCCPLKPLRDSIPGLEERTEDE